MSKKTKQWTCVLGLFTFFFLFTNIGYAVDFSIPEAKIDAYLKENGSVQVKESFTYSFNGSFNGITREIIPKEGSQITNFNADESGQTLRAEKEKHLYKIHRQGKDGTITVNIHYTILQGVEVYADGAQFYWPFFDRRNKSTYENLTITVHPPQATNDVIALGYDEAFDTEVIRTDGSVQFQFGHVPNNKNGDIRVVYNPALFPNANQIQNTGIKNQLSEERQVLYAKAADRAAKQETLSNISLWVVPLLIVIFLVILSRAIIRSNANKFEVDRITPQSFFVPEEALSIPATIRFTRGHLPAEALAAGLLDLLRKKFITKMADEQFKWNDRTDGMLKHEQLLANYLFKEVGTDGIFSFDMLEAYTKNKKNHEPYHSFVWKWQLAVMEEVKERHLYEKQGKIRWFAAVIAFILLPYEILLAVYELYGWFISVLIMQGAFLIFAIFYNPKSPEAWRILRQWQLMKQRTANVTSKVWETLSDDEQMRAYMFGIGTNDQAITKKAEALFQPTAPTYSYIMLAAIASSHFATASKTTEAAGSSSSSGSYTGGGVGGGGGGSGAF